MREYRDKPVSDHREELSEGPAREYRDEPHTEMSVFL